MPREPITVPASADTQRLDRWLRHVCPTLSYVQVQKALRTGAVRLDGKRVDGAERLIAGQLLRVPPFWPVLIEGEAEAAEGLTPHEREWVNNMILFQDDHIFVLNKPSGLSTQGGSKTIHHLDRLLAGLPQMGGEPPRLVHRLDRDTSGLLVVARTLKVARALGFAWQQRDVEKTYLALVYGEPVPHDGEIDAPLIKKWDGDMDRVVVDEAEGQGAYTEYTMLDHAHQAYSLLALKPRTGRQHQLRAHCWHIGHPIIGDSKYRPEQPFDLGAKIARQLYLHAWRLDFKHPIDGKALTFMAPLPQHWTDALNALGLHAPKTKAGKK